MKCLSRLGCLFGHSETSKFWNHKALYQEDGHILNDSRPRLPGEIWRKIIRYTIGLEGANTVEPGDPFLAPYIDEEYPEIDSDLFVDRANLSLVNSSWNIAVSEVTAEYLIIYSGRQLARQVETFETAILAHHSHRVSKPKKKKQNQAIRIRSRQRLMHAKPLGEWTTRIDFKIIGPYSVKDVLRLIQCTPNLRIYLNKNSSIDNIPRRPFPTEIVHGLIKYNAASLLRIDWAGTGECPKYADLVRLCTGLPHLMTLRLISIHSYHLRDLVSASPLVFPALKHLTLGPRPHSKTHRENSPLRWDPLIYFLCLNPRVQLPCLEYLDCDIVPQLWKQFFSLHGHKLQTLRTTSPYALKVLPEILEYCQNLKTLLISQGEATPMEFPAYHPNVARICILPSSDTHVRVPGDIFTCGAMWPLDNLLVGIERMVAPCLAELKIWNMEAYCARYEYRSWLQCWMLRWNLHRVAFLDKNGIPYEKIHDRDEAMLDLVRF
ncbi:hypothetical protein CVT26_007471 [Gymnopilus dilepis]|uniref:F-box domain-containing protein n=1 Tax=Gymnopilus dilepis TaxID=231916 RepID=A0A409W7U4_9AGAR|nr:hypothetical protein CVT26_007471 [Gymnopilus dilepis]